MSLDIPIHLLQLVLESGNALLTVAAVVMMPVLVVAWRAPELTLRYFFTSTLTALLTRKARERFQDTFRSLEADRERGSRDDSEKPSQ